MNPEILNYAVYTKTFSTRGVAKGQKISKANSGVLDSFKKRAKRFFLNGLKWVKENLSNQRLLFQKGFEPVVCNRNSDISEIAHEMALKSSIFLSLPIFVLLYLPTFLFRMSNEKINHHNQQKLGGCKRLLPSLSCSTMKVPSHDVSVLYNESGSEFPLQINDPTVKIAKIVAILNSRVS